MVAGHIFVVDSDQTQLNRLAGTLGDAGYYVSTFSDPNLCLDAMEKQAPDLILSEIILPELDGFEFCRSVRHQTDAPFIFISTLSDPDSIQAAFDAGGSDHLESACPPVQLLATLEENLKHTSGCSVPVKPPFEERVKKAKQRMCHRKLMPGEVRVKRVAAFLDQCTLDRTPELLAQEFFEILKPMGIQSSLLVRVSGKTTYFSDGQGDTGLERKYIESVCAQWDQDLAAGGQLEIDNGHLVVGFKYLTLFVRNYDEQLHAQHLDFLAGFLKSIEMVVFSDAKPRQKAALHQQEAEHLLAQSERALSTMRTTLSSCESRMMNVMTLLVNEAGIQIDSFDLPPDDEEKMMTLVKDVMDDLVQLYAESVHIDDPLRDVMQDLKEFLGTAFSSDTINFSQEGG